MKTFTSFALVFSSLVACVSAHGYIVSPPRRAPGTEMSAVCGQEIYNNQESDPSGPIELLLQSASSIVNADACHLWLCKGNQFADNTAQVQTYSLGQTVDMKVNIIAPHTGYANVSIVDTKTNTVKGSFLKSWAVYASTSTGVTADETDFSITIPTDLTGCTTAGECIIQWFWYAPPSINQTYESCVDFIIGDGTAASASATTPTSTPVVYAIATTPTTSSIIKYSTTSTAVVVSTTPVPIESTSPTESPPTEAMPTTTPAATTSVTTPTTFVTKTRTCTYTSTTTPAVPSSSCYATSVDYNECLDAANACIRNAQSKTGGAVDFSACDAQWVACKMC